MCAAEIVTHVAAMSTKDSLSSVDTEPIFL